MNALLQGHVRCEMREYKGQHYIELDGRKLVVRDHCGSGCKECHKHLWYALTWRGSLDIECDKMTYGYLGTAEDLVIEHEARQTSLDSWV